MVLQVGTCKAGPGRNVDIGYSARGSGGTKLGDTVWEPGKARTARCRLPDYCGHWLWDPVYIWHVVDKQTSDDRCS